MAACIAMLIGTTLFFFLKNKYVVTPAGEAIGGKPDSKKYERDGDAQAKFTKKSVLILIGLIIIFYFLFQYLSWDSKTAANDW